jgi:Co/Zn/Cd efflux system component
MAAAIILWRPQYKIADPICTFIFSVIVFFTTTRMVGQLMSVIMEATPLGFKVCELREKLMKIPGVQGTHDLHVWQLSSG